MQKNLNKDINKAISASAGIGRSNKEAEDALKVAKEGKKIHTYSGKEIPNCIDDIVKKSAERSIDRKKEVEQGYNLEDIFDEQIKDFSVDPKSGTLTPFGFNLKKQDRNYNHPHFMLIDGNNMHEWNDILGYDLVSDHLSKMGQAINNSIRNDESLRYPDLVAKSLVNRVHGSAGDEYGILIDCPEENIIKVGKRILKNIYNSQYIGACLGIGKNQTEAELALKKAKKHKTNISSKNTEEEARKIVQSDDISKIIQSYNGERLKEINNPAMDNIVKKTINYLNQDKNSELFNKLLEMQKYDPNTGCLTQYGSYLNNQDYKYNILIDADNMHEHNEEEGYENVSKKLNILGKTLVSLVKDGEVVRIHGTAGDEFLVRTNSDNPEMLAEYILKSSYNAQLNYKKVA